MDYVYAVARDVPADVLDGLHGVGGQAVHRVAGAGLDALVSAVPLEDFSGERLEASLQDLSWLADTARAHHHVVDTVGHAVALVPLALATVFYDADRVRAVLEQRGPEFGRILDDLTSRSEFGVKAYVPDAAPDGPDGDRPGSGTEYLRRRRDAVGRAKRVVEAARAAALTLHDVATEAAVRSRRHRVHDSALTGRTEQMVLNGAYLVDRDRVEQWRAAVGRAIPDGLAVEVTGPWVPYSFVDGDGG